MSTTDTQTDGPGVGRWLTVGLLCYGGWLGVNLLVAALYPWLRAVEIAGGKAGERRVRRICARILRAFFLGYLPGAGLYRVAELPDRQRIASAGPCVYVANHRSWLDPLLVYALIPDAVVPVAVGYTRIPLAGRVMRWLGAQPFDRTSPQSVIEGADRLRQALGESRPVAAFPEGTRAPAGEIGPFADLAFKIAADAGAAIVPLVLHLGVPFLGPGSENFLTARKADLTIRMLEPIRPATGDRAADLARRARKRMAEELARLDGITR